MSELPILLLPALAEGARQVVITGADHHHLCRVLRLRRGATLELRDGRGLTATATLSAVESDRAVLALESFARPAPPRMPVLRLALPLLKGKRLDWALEKGTELGVGAFHLFVSAHAVVHREKAPARYTEIVAAAYRQSRRLLLPAIHEPQAFAALLDEARRAGWGLLWADERLEPEADTLGSGIPVGETPGADEFLAWIGPEGGFSAEERQALAAAGARPLSLGPHRLRAETAALAMACRLLLTGAGSPR
jgi:16S rRNA (uracil1498-N3)-methyltransferase